MYEYNIGNLSMTRTEYKQTMGKSNYITLIL